MKSKPERGGETAGQMRSLLALALLAPIAGAAAGILGAIFRLALAHADRLRDAFVVWTHGQHLAGFFLVVTVCASATAIAAWLVRRFSPDASGSGISHVECSARRTRTAAVKILPKTCSWWNARAPCHSTDWYRLSEVSGLQRR